MSAETLRAIRRRTYAARDRDDKKAHACAHRRLTLLLSAVWAKRSRVHDNDRSRRASYAESRCSSKMTGADLYGNRAGLTKQERNPFIAVLERDVDSSADITHGSNGAYSPCVPRAHRCLQTMDRGRLTPTSLQRGRRPRM